MNAARKNNVETVKLLLQQGADVTVKDATDKTSLYMAAEDDCWDVLNVRNFVLTGLLADTTFVEPHMSVVFCYTPIRGLIFRENSVFFSFQFLYPVRQQTLVFHQQQNQECQW